MHELARKPNAAGKQHSTSLAKRNVADKAIRHGDDRLSRAEPALGYEFSSIPVHGRPPARIQPKLTIGAPGDAFEQEADRIADQVIRMPEPRARAQAAPANPERSPAPAAQIQTNSMGGGESGGIAAPPIVPEVLNSPGQPLDSATRDFFEPRFGRDFSDVRVHADTRADQATRNVQARAFTHGRNIAFRQGEYDPGTDKGRLLLAHELTHTLSQRGSKAERIQRQPLPREAKSEGLDPDSNPAKGATDRANLRAQATGTLSKEALLKAAAESLVEIGGTAKAADKAIVVAELVKMPLLALSALKKKGVKVVVCRNSVTEIRPDLKGVRPRGWPEGSTWDTVPGLNDPSNKRVIIATRDGRVPPTGNGHGAANLVLHEVGHAVGDAVASGGVTDPKFIAARDKDKARLNTYEGQAGAPGVQETYAESLARFYSQDPSDEKKYPNLHAYWASDPIVDERK